MEDTEPAGCRSHCLWHTAPQTAQPCSATHLAKQLRDHQATTLAVQRWPWPSAAAAEQSSWRSHHCPQTSEGEKLLLPNRLSSFSCPALHRAGPRCRNTPRGTSGLSLAHPSPGLSTTPRLLSAQLMVQPLLQTRLLRAPHQTASIGHGSRLGRVSQARAQRSMNGSHQEGRARSYIQLPGGTPCCRTTRSISTEF